MKANKLHDAAVKAREKLEAERAAEDVLAALLEHCKTLKINLGQDPARWEPVPKKSDSKSVALHQAAHIGSRKACELLIDAGADLFNKKSQTRSGWLPVHVACRRAARPPARDLVPWLLEKMGEGRPGDTSYLDYPTGFAKHADVALLFGPDVQADVQAYLGEVADDL